jgi:hypothetical protein
MLGEELEQRLASRGELGRVTIDAIWQDRHEARAYRPCAVGSLLSAGDPPGSRR